MAKLTVSRAHGGTVFHVEPETWNDLVRFLGGWLEQPSLQDVLEQSIAAAEPGSRWEARGQGFKVSPKVRKAIEIYAMQKAKEHFLSQNYDVEDVSQYKPFDLNCTLGNKNICVEVKGTQTEGEQVLLTPNEVEFAKANTNRMVLFIMNSVEVLEEDDRIVVQGGSQVVLDPWDIESGQLDAVGFKYTLPSAMSG